MRFLATLLVLLLICCFATAAEFVVSYDASAQSGNTVKLIRNGYTFAGASPNVVTMTWNATRGLYEASLSDATHVNDYYRIEDGSGNVVVDTFTVSSKIIDADQIEDLFVRNDGDDVKRGNLEIIPASGTTNVELIIDNSSTTLQLTASDTGSVSTTGHTLQLQAAQIDLQTSAGSDIPIFGIGQSSTSNSAVTRANIDTVKGVGWTYDSGTNTLAGLRGLIDDLSGTGTFSTGDSLVLSGSGGRGVLNINWSFATAAVNDSVEHFEIYYAHAALAGYSHSSADISSSTLTAMRSNMNRMGLPERDALSTSWQTFEDWYVIVVAFDHTSPTAKVRGSNQVLISGGSDPLDSSTPIIGDATSVVDGLEQLANEVSNLQAGVSSSGVGTRVVYAANFVGSAAGTPTEVEWYQVSASSTPRIYFTFYKDDTWNALKMSWQSKHSAGSKDGTFYLGTDAGTATKTITHSATPATWQTTTLTHSVSSLAEGLYQGTISLADGSGTTSDTLYIRRAFVTQYHE